MVLLERVDQSAHPDLPEFPVAIVRAEILFSLRSEEQEIRHNRLAVRPSGKSVNPHITRPDVFAQILVQALEQAAVEERDVLEQRQRLAGLLKQIAMAVKTVRHEVLLVPRPAALVHFRIQRGEEQILQNRLVEYGILPGILVRREPVE